MITDNLNEFVPSQPTETPKIISCESYRNLEIVVINKDGFKGTILFLASNSDTMPDSSEDVFAMQIKKHDDDTGLNGTTGIEFAGTEADATYGHRVNSDQCKWIVAVVSVAEGDEEQAGTVCVQLCMSDNK